MAYLNNTEITVDAILTKKGREKLAAGDGLNITKFALGDDVMMRQLKQFRLLKLHPMKLKY